MASIGLITVTWSFLDGFEIEKTSLFKSFKKFNPGLEFKHFHFNRGHFQNEERDFNERFGRESEYLLYKITMLKRKLEQVESDYIIFCDANDVTFLNSVDHLPSLFDLENNLIVGMEKNQWPTPEKKADWAKNGFLDYSGFDAENGFYLNSGTVLGKKEVFSRMLGVMEEKMLSIEFNDNKGETCGGDQSVYTWYYNAKCEPNIKIDYGTAFSLNTFKRSAEDFYLDSENKIVSKLNGAKPCVVHDNGWNHGSPKFLNHFELKRLYSDSYPHLKNISKNKPMPPAHQEYLFKLRDEFNFNPKTIWDVGACVLHWEVIAKEVWPNSEYVLFDAMEESEELFQETNHRYCIGVFSEEDDKDVTFFKNVTFPGGNSYYMENPKHSGMAEALFANPGNQFSRKTITLDSAQRNNHFPMPDLLKIDVQGCEIDILKGATNVLKSVKHLIVELQHVEYNLGAQLCVRSIPFIESLGFKLIAKFSENGHVDADYHFVKV
jgi:FkbM family methyltransferase